MTLTELRASARRKVSYQLTSSDYPDADLDDNLNEWLRTITGWVMEATGVWEFSGEKSTTNLVQNQTEYVLPSGLVALNRVAIKYPNSSVYVKARRLDDKETDSAFENDEIVQGSEASPVYRVFDNSIFIYPKPSAAVSAGLAIETLIDITELSASGDSPNLNPLVHKALAVGGAMDYCDAEEMDRRYNRLERQMFGRPGGDGQDGLKHLIQVLAATRDRSERTQIRPRVRSYK